MHKLFCQDRTANDRKDQHQRLPQSCPVELGKENSHYKDREEVPEAAASIHHLLSGKPQADDIALPVSRFIELDEPNTSLTRNELKR